MTGLLRLSSAIDRLNLKVGAAILWLVLIAVLVSAINAIVRKIFSVSSNAYLELQWYLFAAIFLLGAGYTLLKQGHVRIDVILARFSKPTQIRIEIFGLVFFLMPFIYAVISESWPLVVNAYLTQEMSENSGGLIRWPVYALLPIGFALLGLQGLSELIKRIGFLKGLCPDPNVLVGEKSDEGKLAEALRAEREAANPSLR